MDPWMISGVERVRHAEQFSSLGPLQGFVSGAQAKGFLMQSGLPPMVLAQIWGLADVNGDGQMDLNEFSIACKLITMKLKGFELPSALPPSILAIPQVAVATPSVPAVSAVQGMAVMSQPMPVMSQPMPQAIPQAMPQVMTQAMPAVSIMTSSIPSIMPQQTMVAMPATSMMVHPVPASMASPLTQATHMGMVPSDSSEWGVPAAAQSKYAAVFHQTDKTRTGFLAGVQARNILLQSGLPQNVLAQIWGLSDVDKDGRLSLEEFILSGHLIDLATKGEVLPAVLPPSLIPLSQKAGSRADTVSTPGSCTNEVSSPSTFEDKRRENFNKGQAELERRRQSIVDQQKKEEEERKKKEREEAEEREKQRQEMERQRLREWEAQRKEELLEHRQREEDKLLELKAKQENTNKELEAMRDKVKNLTTSIGDSRTGVSDIKTFIDGMRASRDTKMQDMADLKAKLREQNERLIIVTQEKAQLEAKNKANSEKIGNGEQTELTDFDIKKMEKEKEVEELKVQQSEKQLKKDELVENHKKITEILCDHRQDLERIIESCKELYMSFDEKRREIRAEKAKRIRELTDPDHAWGNEDMPSAEKEETTNDVAMKKYRALYDYDASKDDELSFKAGTIIECHGSENAEEGWLEGRLGDQVGWIPQAFVEEVCDEEVVEPSAASEARVLFDWEGTDPKALKLTKGDVVAVLGKQENWWFGKCQEHEGFFPSSFVSEDSLSPRGSTPTDPPPSGDFPSLVFRAVYAFESTMDGDLTFNEGEEIQVTRMEATWWTGHIGDRQGVFPYNYVEEAKSEVEQTSAPAVEDSNAPVAPVEETPVGDNGAGTLTKAKSKKKKKEGDGKKKPVLGKVVAPYEATSKEQLTLAMGQLVIIRKKTSSGWWQGEIQDGKKRQVGWFPATFVKLNEAEESGEQENVRALFDYQGQQEDELTFKEGDVIKILSKDGEWWKGKNGDQEGVFPANYVEVIPKEG